MEKLRFYNSLTKQIEVFKPQQAGKVRIYNCGPTVYQRQHIGNMRRFLFADFLRRTLELAGYEVREVTNITDVGHLTEDDIDAGEDKIEKAARQQKVAPQEIAKKQASLFFDDLKQLNIQPAHAYPRASQHIPQMQKLISQLIKAGHAYETPSGVYFDVQSWPDYGRLSGNKLEDLEAGRRVEVREEKKHPADFALWVRDDKHGQKWASPWGVGYPGWHIECSAMSLEYLGADIDIHTGGEDNRFPHHENEIAQSEGATGEKFVHFWMHNRHLQWQGKKLAKREGGQITLDTLKERGYSPLALRWLVFSGHYRSKIDFSWEMLDEAQKNMASIKQLLRVAQQLKRRGARVGVDKKVMDGFKAALAEDLNTPRATGVVMEYVGKANTVLAANKKGGTVTEIQQIEKTLDELEKVLGVINSLRREVEAETVSDDIRALVDQREQARRDGDYKKADEIRAQIEKKGYRIEDTSSKPRVMKL